MNNIIQFPNSRVIEYRKKCKFINRSVLVEDEYGEIRKHPCIVMYEEETDIPILYTGLERYLCHLVNSELLNSKTLTSRAYAVCHFLNYILKETNINYLHECTLESIRNFLKSMKTKDDGSEYKRETWIRYRDYVMDFLVMYYVQNKAILPFQYMAEDLKTLTIIRDEKHHKKATIVHNSSFHISAPKTTHKKNRVLIDGYLDLLLYEAKKYEPAITLGIALGAYAGLREGEVVNVTCGRIQTIRRNFGMVSKVIIDLNDEAPYFKKWKKKTNPGTIKKYRPQEVYEGFIQQFIDIFDNHIALMEMKGLDTSADAPLFVNKRGNPMTVQTYSARVKNLFYKRFLPALKATCEYQGTYADNAAFIEAYEIEYPGAHMFRHWFTMYLLTKTDLLEGGVMQLRGDKNKDSMNDYIHANAHLKEIFEKSSYTFQSWILEDIYKDK